MILEPAKVALGASAKASLHIAPSGPHCAPSKTAASMTERNALSWHHAPIDSHESCPGYPQFCYLIGEHPAFSVSRRFSAVRARLLLLKQQRVVALEKQLLELDLQEPVELNLGSFEADANATRLQVLKDLDGALAEYGKPRVRTPPILYSLHEAARQASIENFFEDEEIRWTELTEDRRADEAKY
ncbi:hypothetical protein ACLMJK_009400 [Lecanora helva]